MGVAYKLYASLGLSLTVFDGPITAGEWRAMVVKVFADPDWPPGDLSLTDVTTADASGVSPAERAEIQALNAAHNDRLSGMRSAAVAGKNFMRAREFEREDRSSGLRIIVFDDLPVACTWLGLDVVAVRPMIAEVRAQAQAATALADPPAPA